MSTFASPSAPSSDGIKWADLNGALLVIAPISMETGIQTTFGPADAVRATVTVLDGAQAGTDYNDTLIFPKLLASQVKSQIGSQVLGRLGQGAAKPGQSAPWILLPATDADQQLAQQWLASRMTAPTAPQQAQQYPPAAAMGQTAPQQQWPAQQPAAVPF